MEGRDMSDLQPLYDQVDQLCQDRIERNARIKELEAELRDTKDTLEAVKHSNRELEAEVEKLRESRVTPYAYERVCDALVKAEAERDDALMRRKVLAELNRNIIDQWTAAKAERDRLQDQLDELQAKP